MTETVCSRPCVPTNRLLPRIRKTASLPLKLSSTKTTGWNSAAPAWAQRAALSVAAIWQVENLTPEDGNIRLCTQPLADTLTICAGRKPVFASQPVPCHRIAFGTAFVVRLTNGALAFLSLAMSSNKPASPASPPSSASTAILHPVAARRARSSVSPASSTPERAPPTGCLLAPDTPLDAGLHPPLSIHRAPVAPGLALAPTLAVPLRSPHEVRRQRHPSRRRCLCPALRPRHRPGKLRGPPVFALTAAGPAVVGVVRESPRDFVIVDDCHVETPCKLSASDCMNGTTAVPVSSVPLLL